VQKQTIKLTLVSALVFLVAFGLRFSNWQVEGINPDEPIWQQRIENFTTAISKREWQYTQQSLHPAVTLSWLAATGRSLAGYNSPAHFKFPFYDPLIFWEIHLAEVMPIILVTALTSVFVFLLLQKLTSFLTAFLASLLIAVDPFYLANSRILHMDALLASFMILSFLTILVYVKTSHRWYLAVSGILAGLAILTKINGVVILGINGLALLSTMLSDKGRRGNLVKTRKLLLELLVLGGLTLVTFFVFYPAMWIQPILTVKNLVYGVINRGLTEGGEGMGDVFFFGQVSDNPGWLFYPVVMAFRATPLSLTFGLLGGIWGVRKDRKFIIYYLLFIILVILEMSLVAKKSERYILPVFLALDILAAYGLVGVLNLLRGIKSVKGTLAHILIAIIGSSLVLGQAWYLFQNLSSHYGSYYNPLFGGAPVAAQLVTVGFGEGHKEIADYIDSLPGHERMWVSVFYAESVNPLVKVADIWYPGHWERGDRDANLVIFYINQLQRQKDLSLWQKYQNKKLLKTVTINGVNYAAIFEGPKGLPATGVTN